MVSNHTLGHSYRARSTLNVHSKCLTSPIFFKFRGKPHLAMKILHANFENDRITFRALIGRFTGVTPSVPKKGLKRPQFSNCYISINYYLPVIFFYIKIKSFLFDRFSNLANKNSFWLYRVSNFLGHFKEAIFGANYLKTPHLRFS